MIIRTATAERRRRLSLALGTSALAWGLALPSAAHAQCTPDPTIAYGTTTCSGADANGVLVNTPFTTLTVASGANVTNSGAPAIAVDLSGSGFTYSATDTINILGNVLATGQNAITVGPGGRASPSYYAPQQLVLTIGAGGRVVSREVV